MNKALVTRLERLEHASNGRGPGVIVLLPTNLWERMWGGKSRYFSTLDSAVASMSKADVIIIDDL